MQVSGQLHAPNALPPVPIGKEAGWAPEPVWTWRGEKSCPYRDSNSDPSTVQPVANRYTDCAIAAPNLHCALFIIITHTAQALINVVRLIMQLSP
jgi:hypothetical protein